MWTISTSLLSILLISWTISSPWKIVSPAFTSNSCFPLPLSPVSQSCVYCRLLHWSSQVYKSQNSHAYGKVRIGTIFGLYFLPWCVKESYTGMCDITRLEQLISKVRWQPVLVGNSKHGVKLESRGDWEEVSASTWIQPSFHWHIVTRNMCSICSVFCPCELPLTFWAPGQEQLQCRAVFRVCYPHCLYAENTLLAPFPQ